MSVTDQFRQARDVLLAHRTDIETAREKFSWPRFTHFNFAVDWFDQLAAAPERADQDALVILEEDGSRYSATYAELAARSSQVANWLRELGVHHGDGRASCRERVELMWVAVLAHKRSREMQRD